jgi:hypothetical protein
VRCGLIAFTCRPRWAQPWPRNRKSRTVASPKLVVQRSLNAGFSCYNVTPLPESLCSNLFAAVFKRPSEGGLRAFAFGFYFGLWLDSFALGFLVWVAFGKEKNY